MTEARNDARNSARDNARNSARNNARNNARIDARNSASNDARTDARIDAAPTGPAAPSHWQNLHRRFDTQALRPPALSADDAALARYGVATRAALLAWCSQGAGPGGTPFWQPGALPRVDQRLAIGALRVAGNANTVPLPVPANAEALPVPVPGNAEALRGLQATRTGLSRPAITPSAWTDHVARQLDGSLHLAALPGRAAGLALRLGVKWHDAMWWRQRHVDDPWDAGWALDTPASLHRLQTAFWPRRATLVLADGQAADVLGPCLAALAERQAGFRHPVRWLWVGGMADTTAKTGLATAIFQLR